MYDLTNPIERRAWAIERAINILAISPNFSLGEESKAIAIDMARAFDAFLGEGEKSVLSRNDSQNLAVEVGGRLGGSSSGKGRNDPSGQSRSSLPITSIANSVGEAGDGLSQGHGGVVVHDESSVGVSAPPTVGPGAEAVTASAPDGASK